jgi:hypothetical protein
MTTGLQRTFKRNVRNSTRKGQPTSTKCCNQQEPKHANCNKKITDGQTRCKIQRMHNQNRHYMLQVTNNECCNHQSLQVATKTGLQVCNERSNETFATRHARGQPTGTKCCNQQEPKHANYNKKITDGQHRCKTQRMCNQNRHYMLQVTNNEGCNQQALRLQSKQDYRLATLTRKVQPTGTKCCNQQEPNHANCKKITDGQKPI